MSGCENFYRIDALKRDGLQSERRNGRALIEIERPPIHNFSDDCVSAATLPLVSRNLGRIRRRDDPVPLWSRRRNCGKQSGARHAEHAFGRSYRARICRPPRKARWARASLGSVLLLFCPALLHRFRELLPARSSEAATSLGRRGLTSSLPYTPLCPASFHRL